MRFRAKVFLAVLLPASLLVSLAVAVSLHKIGRKADEAARSDFARTRTAVSFILVKSRTALERLEQTFTGPLFQEIVEKGTDPAKREGLRKGIFNDLESLNVKLDYFGVADSEGKEWLRVNETHSCSQQCRHEGESAWVLHKTSALFGAGGAPFLGVRFFLKDQGGAVIVGTNLRSELENLCATLDVEIALHDGRGEIYRSLGAWTPSLQGEGDVRVAGRHYLAGRSSLEGMGDMTLLLLRNMDEAVRERRWVTLGGAGGLAAAVLVAALVSLRIARGVSRPVEALTGAVQKVATGDFGVQVEVAGQDEIGRLGSAFNEMTVGLRKRQDIMEMTLSRDVAEVFLKGGTERGGERRVLTVVFMDIRGYTSGTEGMDPAEVVVMLNELMDLLAGAIERHGGSVNKFLGDGLMAMFGAPKPLENHPLHAVQAAIEMQKQMERWNHRRTARDLPSFYSGIGINTGDVVVGKVGGRNRLEYTLIGEEVNLTSRICGKAAPRQVLITRQTYEKVKEHIQVKPLEPVVVKGLSYPIHIYEVLG